MPRLLLRLSDAVLRRLAPVLWRIQVVRLQLIRSVTLGAKVVAFRDSEVLLVRHTYRAGWFLPGGGLKRGESAEQGARRELREETGVRAPALDFAGLFVHHEAGRTDHIALFVTHTTAAPMAASWEIADARFWPVTSLPPDIAPADARHLAALWAKSAPSPLVGPW